MLQIGDSFQDLRVIYVKQHRNGSIVCLCQCYCLTIQKVVPSVLLRGHKQSCGQCGIVGWRKRRPLLRNPKRQEDYRAEYRLWFAMRRRCNTPSDSAYANYGGRGITIADTWNYSFEAFFQEVGLRPTPQHSLERIDNNRGYEPGNVRWATSSEQARNRRSSHLITFEGETMTLVAWGERTGLNPGTISRRLKRGWTLQRALTDLPMSAREASRLGVLKMVQDRAHIITWHGEAHTIAEWSARTGIMAATIWQRLSVGWEPGEAITRPPIHQRERNIPSSRAFLEMRDVRRPGKAIMSIMAQASLDAYQDADTDGF